MEISIKELLTVSFTLFAVIDVIGSVPVLVSLKNKMGGINEFRATLISGALMVLFLYIGEPFLNLLGLDVVFCSRRFDCDFYFGIGNGVGPGAF